MKPLIIFVCICIFSNPVFSQVQATLKAGNAPGTVDIFVKSSTTFSQKDEAMTFVIAVPVSVIPAPSLGTFGVTDNGLGKINGIAGLQPSFITNNFKAKKREVLISKALINGLSHYVYTFIFAGTATENHTYVKNVEQLIFTIQFNGCTANCQFQPLLVNLPNGGAADNAYFYFQSNTIGDLTNYATPFYDNPHTEDAVNGGSTDGSALSLLKISKAVSFAGTIKNFLAIENNCKVLLKWDMVKDNSLSHFIIERSIDGNYYSEIGQVNGDHIAELKTYEADDRSAPKGRVFYRIKQVNTDGKFYLSTIQELQINCSGNERVLVYPTLSKGFVNIVLPPGLEQSIIHVNSSVGELIFSDGRTSLNRQLNFSPYANGTYVIKILNNGKTLHEEVIILNK